MGESDGHIDVDGDSFPEGEGAIQVEEKLAPDDGSDAFSAAFAPDDEGVMGVLSEERDMDPRVPGGEG